MFSCISVEVEAPPKRTILFFIGTDTNGLDNGFQGDEPKQQIDAMRAGWIPGRGEMLIYADQTGRLPCLMRLNNKKDMNGLYGIDTIQVYQEESSADPAVLSRVIQTVVQDYPAGCYGMLFFSHASGWLPEGMMSRPRGPEKAGRSDNEIRSLVIDNGEEMSYIDFAAAIPDKLFDFIIFDACFMSDVISLYELRNKAAYVVAASTEIVSPGFLPIFKNEIMRLFDKPCSDAYSVTAGFAQSYMDYIKMTYPEDDVYCSASMSVIRMSEMDNLASTVKAALKGAQMDETTLNVDTIQRFDRPDKLIVSGPRRNRYFDLGHVIENLISGSPYSQFLSQLDRTVVWKGNTKRFLLRNTQNGAPYYAEYDGYFIERHSGMSTYIEQSVYPALNAAYRNSAWYKAVY